MNTEMKETDHCFKCGDLKPTHNVTIDDGRDVAMCDDCRADTVETVWIAILDDNEKVVLEDPTTDRAVILEDFLNFLREKFNVQSEQHTTLKINVERLPTVSEKIERIASILRIPIASLGGGLAGFSFEKRKKELIFGYANGVLGYQLSELVGDNRQGDSTNGDLGNYGSSVVDECRLIVKTLSEQGFECAEMRRRLAEYAGETD